MYKLTYGARNQRNGCMVSLNSGFEEGRNLSGSWEIETKDDDKWLFQVTSFNGKLLTKSEIIRGQTEFESSNDTGHTSWAIQIKR